VWAKLKHMWGKVLWLPGNQRTRFNEGKKLIDKPSGVTKLKKTVKNVGGEATKENSVYNGVVGEALPRRTKTIRDSGRKALVKAFKHRGGGKKIGRGGRAQPNSEEILLVLEPRENR